MIYNILHFRYVREAEEEEAPAAEEGSGLEETVAADQPANEIKVEENEKEEVAVDPVPEPEHKPIETIKVGLFVSLCLSFLFVSNYLSLSVSFLLPVCLLLSLKLLFLSVSVLHTLSISVYLFSSFYIEFSFMATINILFTIYEKMLKKISFRMRILTNARSALNPHSSTSTGTSARSASTSRWSTPRRPRNSSMPYSAKSAKSPNTR